MALLRCGKTLAELSVAGYGTWAPVKTNVLIEDFVSFYENGRHFLSRSRQVEGDSKFDYGRGGIVESHGGSQTGCSKQRRNSDV